MRSGLKILLAFSFLVILGAITLSAQPPVANQFAYTWKQAGLVTKPLPSLSAQRNYSLLVSVRSPMSLGSAAVDVTLFDARAEICRKRIHRGDPDFYLFFAPETSGDGRIELRLDGNPATDIECDVRWLAWEPRGKDRVRLETEPNDTWRQANPTELDEIVFATADDAPYIAVGKDAEVDVLERGLDWYRIDFKEQSPKLVYFGIELPERDNIPMDVSIYRLEADRAVPYDRGTDPVSPPHEVQALNGNKFTTRVLERGTYLVRVSVNHPAYSLRTWSYDPPPYKDPRKAIRAGMDYLLGAGDSWHANTPRRGGITDRVANYHSETSTCIACHPTHFSTRGSLIANANGYPVRMRQQLAFLTERLYNNPRPFYGFPEASWSRLISASANVLSRLASLLRYFESNISGEERRQLHHGVAEYLKLYYRDRTELPPDETNGNTPIVSTYEVAFYSWMVFDELHRRTGDGEYARYRDLVRKLIEQTKHKNMLDLCYQTIALATIDRRDYEVKIAENARRILSLRRASGQWAMLFEPDAPEVEFQTGHCLYALALAGYSQNDPRIARGLRYLLARQQPFGGWFDPLQSYENFRTPFRETQFAVMALSAFHRGPGGKGWNAGNRNPPLELRNGLASVLKELDEIWEKPSSATESRIESLARNQEPLVRQAALLTLGRIGDETALPAITAGLSDPSKMVQYSAAWALRQLPSRKGIGFDTILSALRASSDRTRWGASRVFATHFSFLSRRLDLAGGMLALMHDPSPILRMQASKALWQWWYWNADPTFRGRVEEAFLARMSEEKNPWVRRNLTEGFYNICDENVRYLYNNWIPGLARSEDRERAAAGHQSVGLAQARKIAAALTEGIETPSGRVHNDLLRDGILTALTEFHLRHADPARPEVFARIGNDVETIKFYRDAASILEPVFLRLIGDDSPEVRKRLIRASAVVRDNAMNRFAPQVVRRLLDSDSAVRSIAARFYKTLSLPTDGAHRAETSALLARLIESGDSQASLAGLDLVASTRGKLSGESALSVAVKKRVAAEDPAMKAVALRAATALPEMMKDPEVLATARSVLETASGRNAEARVPEGLLRVALELAYLQPAVASRPEIPALLDRLIARREPEVWKLILELADRNRSMARNLQVVSLLSEAMLGKNDPLARQAREILRKNPDLQRNPGVAAALAESNRRLPPSSGTGRETYQVPSAQKPAVAPLLDYPFFVQRVMPILSAPGPDGMTCVQCHASHTILKLNPPPRVGEYTEDQVRENFLSALRVVDLENPEESLILRKPISTAETEGILNSGRLAHGGGMRWSGSEHPSYRTLLEWIRGANLVVR